VNDDASRNRGTIAVIPVTFAFSSQTASFMSLTFTHTGLRTSSYAASVRWFLPVVRVIELVRPSPLLKPVVFVARKQLWHLLALVQWQDVCHLQHILRSCRYHMVLTVNGREAKEVFALGGTLRGRRYGLKIQKTLGNTVCLKKQYT